MNKNSWKKIEELFHAAEALPASERAAFLGIECADDEELHRSVVSLLEHADKDPELEAVVRQAAHSLLSAEQNLIGDRIGPYLVTGELGQ